DKKFLSAEEAIELFGLDPVQFQQMIDDGEVRALQDRDTWKYRRDEIEGLIQEGLLTARHSASVGDEPQTLEFEAPQEAAGPSDFSFLDADDDASPEGATMIKKSSDEELTDYSASDILVVPDEETPAAQAADEAPAELSFTDEEAAHEGSDILVLSDEDQAP